MISNPINIIQLINMRDITEFKNNKLNSMTIEYIELIVIIESSLKYFEILGYRKYWVKAPSKDPPIIAAAILIDVNAALSTKYNG